MKINLRPFEHQDLKQLHPLYESAFGPESLERWKTRWEWQFLRSPATNLTPSRGWVAENENGRVLGFMGAYPIRLKVGDQEIITFEDGDLMVSKEARRRGVGQSIVKAYHDSEEVLTTSYNYAPPTGRFFRRLGLKPVYCLATCVRPLDLRRNVAFLLQGGRLSPFLNAKPISILIAILCRLFNPILTFLNFIKSPKISSKYTVEQVHEAGPEFDNLWYELSSQFAIIVPRDSKFVQWRFLDDPVFDHILLAARDPDGILRGYIAICISEKKGTMAGRIMDIFCSPTSNEIIDTLISKAIDLFKKARVFSILCLGLHPSIQKRVKRYLYFKPSWLENPLLIYWKGDKRLTPLLRDAKNWHLSYADGDQGFQP